MLCKSKSLLFDFRYGNLYNPGMSNKWVLGTDDYYYYTDILEPGKTTEAFMKSLKIIGSDVNTNHTTGD